MKNMIATIVVQADDEVDPVAVRDVLRNTIWMAFDDLQTGRVFWRQAKVSARDEEPRDGTFQRVLPPAAQKPVEDRG
jgi:hypothetical protein